jgi:Regulator of chromosome condensation (RCC1) repeat
MENINEFVKKIPDSCVVLQIACTLSNSFVVTTSGYLYSWGELTFALGRRPEIEEDIYKPMVVNLSGQKVINLACGDNHVLALTSNCQVYSWGSNEYGQLGHGDCESRVDPKLIELSPIVRISAGSDFSFALVKKDKVDAYVSYVWGNNSNIKLRRVNNDEQLRSTEPVRLLQPAWGDYCPTVTMKPNKRGKNFVYKSIINNDIEIGNLTRADIANIQSENDHLKRQLQILIKKCAEFEEKVYGNDISFRFNKIRSQSDDILTFVSDAYYYLSEIKREIMEINENNLDIDDIIECLKIIQSGYLENSELISTINQMTTNFKQIKKQYSNQKERKNLNTYIVQASKIIKSIKQKYLEKTGRDVVLDNFIKLINDTKKLEQKFIKKIEMISKKLNEDNKIIENTEKKITEILRKEEIYREEIEKSEEDIKMIELYQNKKFSENSPETIIINRLKSNILSKNQEYSNLCGEKEILQNQILDQTETAKQKKNKIKKISAKLAEAKTKIKIFTDMEAIRKKQIVRNFFEQNEKGINKEIENFQSIFEAIKDTKINYLSMSTQKNCLSEYLSLSDAILNKISKEIDLMIKPVEGCFEYEDLNKIWSVIKMHVEIIKEKNSMIGGLVQETAFRLCMSSSNQEVEHDQNVKRDLMKKIIIKSNLSQFE